MPKAAFQFGVKMQDGRKTRKQNKDQKLTNELHKINKILARKKSEKESGEGTYDDDLQPGKKLRVWKFEAPKYLFVTSYEDDPLNLINLLECKFSFFDI